MINLKKWELLSRRDRFTLSLRLGCLILTGLLFVSNPFSTVDSCRKTFYHWAFVFHKSLPIPLFFLSGAVFCEIFLAPKKSKALQRLNFSLAFFALSLAIWSYFPSVFVTFRSIMAPKIKNSVYRLYLKTAMDGDSFYFIAKCDPWGFQCENYGSSPTPIAWPDEKLLGLEHDSKTDELFIKTEKEAVLVKKCNSFED